jgi:membrane-associated phospholipid phosphatase
LYAYQQNNVSLWLLITQMGSVLALGLSVVVAWFVGRQKIAYLLIGNGIVAYALCWILKEIVARPRPAVLLPTIQANDWSAVGYGFPSAHVAIITSIVLVLLANTRQSYRHVLWLAIVLVALSRMFLGVHTPLDVLGGFLVGMFVFCARLSLLGRKN